MRYTVRYGGASGKKYSLRYAKDMVVVRYQQEQSFRRTVAVTHSCPEVSCLEEVCRFDEANITVMKVPAGRNSIARRDAARKALKPAPGVRFAGRVLQDPRSGRPVLYTENFYLKFAKGCSQPKIKALLKAHGLSVKRTYGHCARTFFVSAENGTGLGKLIDKNDSLLDNRLVEYCQPELVREKSYRGAYRQQWHLRDSVVNGKRIRAHANVERAWEISQGQGTTICIIDDGVDIKHQDFKSRGKIVHGRDVTERTNNPRPTVAANDWHDGDAHGTSCAGVACATGKYSASGVAPRARLMPIRCVSAVGSIAEHDAIIWAVDHGADVISCSWGPMDGRWDNAEDPRHQQVTLLPDATREALRYAVEHGREGKGCVIVWAAGNGNESVDNDGYANNDYVMAVAACSDRSTRSVYSDYGNAIWCAFPSSNFRMTGANVPQTPGIWTTDRSDGGNEGYNKARFGDGDSRGRYTETFGGTSSACPGVAGVAALILSARPDLGWIDVNNIIADSCDRIDPRGADYSSETSHSVYLGFGRINARNALETALSYPQ